MLSKKPFCLRAWLFFEFRIIAFDDVTVPGWAV
jgi:hypothetical protein